MSGKKSFKGTNPALSFISSAPTADEAQQAQNAPAEHETHNAQDVQSFTGDPVSKSTQGKKGKKLPRINMAFSLENMSHIQIMARVMGCSATEYVNRLIAADREARGDVAAQAMKLFEEAENQQ